MNIRSVRFGLIAVAIVGAVLAGGCSNKQVRYGDAKGVETVNMQFGSTDLQVIAEAMTRSLLQAPVVANGARPIDGAGCQAKPPRG